MWISKRAVLSLSNWRSPNDLDLQKLFHFIMHFHVLIVCVFFSSQNLELIDNKIVVWILKINGLVKEPKKVYSWCEATANPIIVGGWTTLLTLDLCHRFCV